MGAPGCGLRVGSAWLGHEALLGAEVSEENPQWRCLDPLQGGERWCSLGLPRGSWGWRRGLCRFPSLGETRCGFRSLVLVGNGGAGLCRFCLRGETRCGLESAVGSNGDSVWLGLFDVGSKWRLGLALGLFILTICDC
jgi:hypothetical protein